MNHGLRIGGIDKTLRPSRIHLNLEQPGAARRAAHDTNSRTTGPDARDDDPEHAERGVLDSQRGASGHSGAVQSRD